MSCLICLYSFIHGPFIVFIVPFKKEKLKFSIIHRSLKKDFLFLNKIFKKMGSVFCVAHCIQYNSKETPQLIGLFSQNLVITNFMQCFLYGPLGLVTKFLLNSLKRYL